MFVDDVLVAVPRDFGYFGEVEGTGRYAPWRNADNQAKFKTDLIRMIDLILAGKKNIVSQEHATTQPRSTRSTHFRNFKLTDLAGQSPEQRATQGAHRLGRILGHLVSTLPLHIGVAGNSATEVRR